MWLQFFEQNGHFAINIIAALAFFGVSWLYLDAWVSKRNSKELAKWVGFGLLGLSFVVQATSIEQSVLGSSILGNTTDGIILALRLAAYVSIIVGQLIDPLQVVPKNKGLELNNKKSQKKHKSAHATVGVVSVSSKALLPLGALGVAYYYYKRATIGLERHLKPIAYGFIFIAISDALHMVGLLRDSSNPAVFNVVQAFGWIWLLEQVALLIGSVVIGKWVWSYLTKRFFSQLYMIFTTTIVVIFLLVSVSFTSLLLREIKSNALVNLDTSSHVLSYALDAKQSEATSGASQIAGSSDVISAVLSKDRTKLASLTKNYLVDKKQSGLIITSVDGQVILRAEDVERWGDSLSDDPLVRRALLGVTKSGIADNTNKTLSVRSAVPIRDNAGDVIGSVLTSIDLGSAFVDGVKQSTGLQSAIYLHDVSVASTFYNPDAKTRSTGGKITDTAITHKVLDLGEQFTGTAKLQNKQQLVSFLPIKDADNVIIGMNMVSTPQNTILKTAGRSVELTFLIVVGLILLSVIPVYKISKNLAKQI